MEERKRGKAPGEPLRDQDLEIVTGGIRPIATAEESRAFPPIVPEDGHPSERGGKPPMNSRLF